MEGGPLRRPQIYWSGAAELEFSYIGQMGKGVGHNLGESRKILAVLELLYNWCTS